jgi:PadR family transcriptional regulator PadR
MDTEVFENLRLELRRGSLTLAVLAQLRTEQYGYVLRKSLTESGLAIDENTLYPLLRRLEAQGLLVSHWREEEKRNKRFYRLSPQGEVVLYQLLNEYEAINAALDRIVAVHAGRNGFAAEAELPSPAMVPISVSANIEEEE